MWSHALWRTWVLGLTYLGAGLLTGLAVVLLRRFLFEV
jgi:hypothetical protein